MTKLAQRSANFSSKIRSSFASGGTAGISSSPATNDQNQVARDEGSNIGVDPLVGNQVSQNASNVVGDDTVFSNQAGDTQITQDQQDRSNENLDTFSNILDEIGSIAPQAVPTAIDEATDTLNPAVPTKSSREKSEASSALDAAPIDAGGGVQVVEHEVSPEIPVEVESFIHRVEDHQDQAPDEIVIADGTAETPKANYPSTPVVVLPITEEEEKEGKKKSLKFSFRWLVEWSHKVIKMFTGKVIYREKENE